MSIQDLKKAALVNSTHPHLLPPSLSSSMSPQMHPSTPAPERPRKGSPNPAGPTASEQPGRAHRGPGDTPGPLCGEAHARRYTVRRWRASLLRMARGAGQASTFPKWPGGKSARFLPGGGQGGLYKLEFLHFEFCTKSLYAICSVFLRICAGNNSKHPLFLMSNCWEPYIICSLILKKWHRFCRARICRFIFSPARNPPPPPGYPKRAGCKTPSTCYPQDLVLEVANQPPARGTWGRWPGPAVLAGLRICGTKTERVHRDGRQFRLPSSGPAGEQGGGSTGREFGSGRPAGPSQLLLLLLLLYGPNQSFGVD